MIKSSYFKIITFLFVGFVSLAFTGCTKKSAESKKSDSGKVLSERAKEVVVYTYDSFVSEWGPGEEIKKLFEEKTGLKLTWVDCGEGVQVLSRAVLEKNNVQADVILGIDNNLAVKAYKADILQSYKPENAQKVIPEDVTAQLGSDWFLTPYDYSHFALIYDTQSNVPCPKSLEDLTDQIYAKKIILMDPRTSTPGLGFAAWTVAVYGDKVLDYWKALKPNILTMAPSWSTGYGLFKKGEAPLVISYTTSPASHVEYDNTDRYVAAVFEQGHVMQVEGVGILKDAPNLEGAKLFLDFLISDEAQRLIPLTQWMNPANCKVELPESYKVAAPIPEKTLATDSQATDEAVAKIMQVLAD